MSNFGLSMNILIPKGKEKFKHVFESPLRLSGIGNWSPISSNMQVIKNYTQIHTLWSKICVSRTWVGAWVWTEVARISGYDCLCKSSEVSSPWPVNGVSDVVAEGVLIRIKLDDECNDLTPTLFLQFWSRDDHRPVMMGIYAVDTDRRTGGTLGCHPRGTTKENREWTHFSVSVEDKPLAPGYHLEFFVF